MVCWITKQFRGVQKRRRESGEIGRNCWIIWEKKIKEFVCKWRRRGERERKGGIEENVGEFKEKGGDNYKSRKICYEERGKWSERREGKIRNKDKKISVTKREKGGWKERRKIRKINKARRRMWNRVRKQKIWRKRRSRSRRGRGRKRSSRSGRRRRRRKLRGRRWWRNKRNKGGKTEKIKKRITIRRRDERRRKWRSRR